jgi:dihydrofolate synthase/folylpolyglutamate synthase
LGSDPLAWLFGLEPVGIKFGLDTITALVEELGHPERAFASVHIAGTNGKGSVVAMVDAALREAGHRSARYTSPHLLDLTERFVVDGRPIERAALAAATADVREAADRLRARARLQAHPTFFEVTTAVAFELFRRAGAGVAVCEVGLGGRLDATNVLQPVAAAITTIGFDHQQYLGHTLAEITAEKAGIIKPGVPVVVGKLDPEALEAVRAIAGERQAPLTLAHEGVTVSPVAAAASPVAAAASPVAAAASPVAAAASPVAADFSRTTVNLRTPTRDYGDVALALAGHHQIDNAIVAVRLLETLDQHGLAVPADAVVAGLERVVWPGRLETRRLPDGREALLDAAHNPDGALALAAFLTAGGDISRPLVFGAMRDKDTAGMLRALAPVTGVLVLTRASNLRSADPSALADQARAIAPELRVIVEPAPSDALAAAWRLSPRIVVAGSIFLLADVMNEIK